MNTPTHIIISPHFVKATKRLLCKTELTSQRARILLILARTLLLDGWAQFLDSCKLHQTFGEIRLRPRILEELQIWDPRVVVQDGTVVVKAPEGDLLELGDKDAVVGCAGIVLCYGQVGDAGGDAGTA